MGNLRLNTVMPHLGDLMPPFVLLFAGILLNFECSVLLLWRMFCFFPFSYSSSFIIVGGCSIVFLLVCYCDFLLVFMASMWSEVMSSIPYWFECRNDGICY